jgi:hypothetical protein
MRKLDVQMLASDEMETNARALTSRGKVDVFG